ncbi:hypothetical protein Dacsa_2337 [Dactylococcopsis salina PCC 8305]|uniref:Uncharacterized protein n=1 Tax=Dactylococcopsis salina (strain PCC 8305) TaxID=13035 RepID=K9YVM7_DACS8|nr:hypothetical protein Dacsa_2337 [Dactylococcopsis salina PCC 8305]
MNECQSEDQRTMNETNNEIPEEVNAPDLLHIRSR